MWPGSSPTSVVNGAAGMIIAALVIAALYFGRDLLMPLALAGAMAILYAAVFIGRRARILNPTGQIAIRGDCRCVA